MSVVPKLQAKERRRIGALGEDLALRFLLRGGYFPYARNYRCRFGEIDIIAWDGPILCFVEVRTRETAAFGGPLESIGRGKIQRVVRAARDFLSHWLGPLPQLRFDAVGIVLGDSPEITLVQGAFEA